MKNNKFKQDLTGQSLIFGYNVKDFIADDDIEIVIDEIVEQLDTSKIENKYSEKGQKSYHPKILIKLIFYGYTIGVRSSRKIMKGCYKDLGFMYLSKLYKPDYRTISDFRKNNLEILSDYFVEILKYCNELGMLDAGVISIDGSKFRANASSKRTKTLLGYEKWEERLKKEIGLLNQKGIELDEEENNRLNKKRDTNKIPKEIKQREILLAKIQEAKKIIKEMQQKITKEKDKKNVKLNLTDHDACFQKERNGVIRPNYNIQITTTSSQIISAIDATKSPVDVQELKPMLEQTELNTEQIVEELKADSGYASYENYEELDERNIDAYVPDKRLRQLNKQIKQGTLNPYAKENFKYDQDKDIYICPQGNVLKFFQIRFDRPKEKRYKCNDCTNCSDKLLCTKAKYRTINRHNSEHLQEAMRKKLSTEAGKKKYYERMNMVESPFGHLKHNLGFAQLLFRGIEKVKQEVKLMAIGFNISKIHKYKMVKANI